MQLVSRTERSGPAAEPLVRLRGFRPEPAGPTGQPLQGEIVANALAGKSQLGILPTGTGKSVCYQLPALSSPREDGCADGGHLPARGAHGGSGRRAQASGRLVLLRDQRHAVAAGAPRRAGPSSAGRCRDRPDLARAAAKPVRPGDPASSAKSATGSSTRRTASRSGGRISVRTIDTSAASCASTAGDDPLPPIICLTATAKPSVIQRHPRPFPTAGSGSSWSWSTAVRFRDEPRLRGASRPAAQQKTAEILRITYRAACRA